MASIKNTSFVKKLSTREKRGLKQEVSRKSGHLCFSMCSLTFAINERTKKEWKRSVGFGHGFHITVDVEHRIVCHTKHIRLHGTKRIARDVKLFFYKYKGED